jgi:hypothetical protein
MAGELVKWQGGNLAKPKASTALERCRKARAAALAALERPAVPALPARPSPGLVVDLPRKCALHGGPYAARYVYGDDRRFRLGSMIAVTEGLYLRQYAGNGSGFTVPNNDLGQETCPLCGAFGLGAVLCGSCGLEVCYGRTAGQYFRCHPSCGGQGVMQAKARVQHGVSPIDMRWR